MRKLLVVPLFACGAALALSGGASGAAGKTAAPVRSVVQFVETYSEDDDTETGRFTMDARIPLDPADVATFDADTYFDLYVGYFDFDGYLSDDPFWKPGKTSATFTDVGWDGDTQLVARLWWSPTALNVHVVATTGDDIDPICSDDYAWDDTGVVADETDAEIEFGNSDVSWDVLPVAGRVRSWTTKAGDFSTVRTHGRAVQ